MSSLQLAFSTLACPDWSWDDMLRYGPQFGYQGVEVRLIQRETNLLIRPEFQPDQLALRRRELDRTGFQVCGLASSVHLHDEDDALYAEHLRSGGAYLALAQSLGANFVRIFGDLLPPEAEPARRTRTMQRIADGLKRLGDQAGPRGVQVLIETHGDFSATEPNVELMQFVDHPHVGVLWDTHHPWRFHSEAIAESWQQLEPWTRHTHWKDSVLIPEQDHQPESIAAKEAAALAGSINSGHQHADYVLFGGGEFPARECLRVLSAGSYAGWHSLEWEKMWHPDLLGPEIALPLFPVKMRELWNDVTRTACA
jgi:sugar phosphate isomerase/epimerase